MSTLTITKDGVVEAMIFDRVEVERDGDGLKFSFRYQGRKIGLRLQGDSARMLKNAFNYGALDQRDAKIMIADRQSDLAKVVR